MPTAYNKSFKINYQVEGSGPPLLLLHDIAGSLYSWLEDYYVAPLSERFQVITPDLRGHGASDKPNTPAAYVLPILVEDMLAVLDDLEVTAAHVVGYSIGGRIALGFSRYVPERLLSLTVGGTGYQKPPAKLFERWINSLRGGPEMFVSQIESGLGRMIHEPRRSRELSNEGPALIAMLEATKRMKDIGIGDALTNLTIPSLFFCGTDDALHGQASAAAKLVPSSLFLSIPGADHFTCMDRISQILPYIRSFLVSTLEDQAA